MKKVLIVAASYKPAWIYGGPTYCISALCETLSAQGYDVHVITTNANGKADFTKKNGSVTIIDGIPVIYYKRITGDHTSEMCIRDSNRVEFLLENLIQIAKQSYQGIEICISDDCSTDNTEEALKSFIPMYKLSLIHI